MGNFFCQGLEFAQLVTSMGAQLSKTRTSQSLERELLTWSPSQIPVEAEAGL